MPSFSKSLELVLHKALSLANERRHEYATLEHLLLGLTEERDAVAVMRACGVDIDLLRRNLFDYLDGELSSLVMAAPGDAKPTRGDPCAIIGAGRGNGSKYSRSHFC
jgi:ATP-dependent Clp protease ATP-binding subunit ClpA